MSTEASSASSDALARVESTDEELCASLGQLFALEVHVHDAARLCAGADPSATEQASRALQLLQADAETHRGLLLQALERMLAEPLVARCPRIAEVGKRLQLSAREVLALSFIMLRCSGHRGSEDYEKRGALHNLRGFSGMRALEAMQFVSGSRPHLEQGLFDVDDELAADFGDATFKMSREG